MERATEALTREGHKLNEVPRHPVMEDKFWDDLAKGYGIRPVRRDTEYPELKVAWRRMVLGAASKESEAAAWSAMGDEDGDEEDGDEEDSPDREARRFRDRWNSIWSGFFGHFEDITRIPRMRYTDDPPLDQLRPCNTLQVFSVKVSGLGQGFKWPLNVFGLVAIRDSVDRNRNIIFLRSRDRSQILTEKDPYLLLIGPSRAVVLVDPPTIEVELKVKGPIESEDKTLYFLGETMPCIGPHYSFLLHQTYPGKFCTLEFMLGRIMRSLEATIFVRMIDGAWPDGFHGQFAACTAGFRHCGDEKHIIGDCPSLDNKKIILCRFGAGKIPVTGSGTFELFRHVVSAEDNCMLKVSVEAWQDDSNVVEVEKIFWPQKAGRSYDTLELEGCKMKVTVAWSLISPEWPDH